MHFHALSSKRRRNLAQKVAENIEDLSSLLLHIEIIIAKDKFKKHANKIINTIKQLKTKFRVERIILGSDFKYYLKKNLKIGPHIIDDKAIEVQVADVLANTYRKYRRLIKTTVNIL